jgi:PAS domain S-box-containing protein
VVRKELLIAPTTLNGTTPVNILLVDDYPANLLALEGVLEPLGQNIVRVNSGEEALKWLLGHDCAVILLDVQMPVLDGFETAGLIKEREKSRHIPIIFVTAVNRDERFVLQGYAAGAVDYIVKPFGGEVLKAKVSVFVELFQKGEELKRRSAEEQDKGRQLSTSEADLSEFKSTLDATLDGVFMLDAQNLHFSYINHGGAGQLGYEREEILTLTPFDILPEEDAAILRHKLTELRAGTLESYTFQTQQRRKDGSEVPVELFMQFVAPEQGAGRFVAVARDITERKQAESRIERQLQHLMALRSIDMAITGSLDLRVTLNVLLDQVTTQLKVDAAAVLLLNSHTQMLEFAAGRGFHSSALQHTHLRMGEGHAGQVALERRTLHIPDLMEQPGDLTRAPLLSCENFVAYFSVPLIAKGHVEGVLEIFQRTPLKPDQEWLDFLEALAGQAAIALDNATLFDSLQRSNTNLALAYDTTIEGWSRALDLRDKETEGHSVRVTEGTLRLARALNLSSEELVHVRRGALLHDIGKMGIPDSILLKPGPLTDEEWVIMRRHPVYAFELLSPIAYLNPALDIPYCHHEKWDGSGYPRGLKTEQIPLSARIFAVIDVWDALRSNRPYRAGWPAEKVREHIGQGSGTHFDPQVVRAFQEMGM